MDTVPGLIVPESARSEIIVAQLDISCHELSLITQVDTSEKTSDLIILAETSGIRVSPVIVWVSIFISSTPVETEPVSTIRKPVFPSK